MDVTLKLRQGLGEDPPAVEYVRVATQESRKVEEKIRSLSLKPGTGECEQRSIPKTITLVVPSPHSSSCIRLSSIMFFAEKGANVDLAKNRISVVCEAKGRKP